MNNISASAPLDNNTSPGIELIIIFGCLISLTLVLFIINQIYIKCFPKKKSKQINVSLIKEVEEDRNV